MLAVEGQGVLRLPAAEPDGEGWQRATVELRDAVSGRYTLRVRLETLLPEGAETIEAPRVETVGTERESGLIAARGSAELSLEPSEARGLAQVSLRRLPDPVADALGWERGEDDPPLAYRYLRRPWGLALRVRPIEPELEGEVHTLALVRDDEVGLATTIRYTVRKRGVFGVRLRLPAGYQLQEFADEKAIKDHRIERLPGGGEVLAVDFEKQVPVGSFTLGLFGAVRRTPQPESGAVELELPRVGLEGVVRETGVLAVAALSHLELVRKDARALWAIPVQELAEQGFPYGVGRGEELSFGFRYGAATPELAATFSVSKREPKVGARLETLVDAQEDAVRVTTTIHLTVEYAGIDRVRLEVPARLADEQVLAFEHEGIVDRAVAVEGERAIVTLTLQGRRTGAFALRCAYPIPLDRFAAGQQKTIVLRPLRVLDCFAQSEELAVKKHANLVIEEEHLERVERRDPRDLPEGLRADGVIQGYRTVAHPSFIALRLTKYDFQAPPDLVIRHLHQAEVVKASGVVEAEAVLAVQNRARQYLRVALPAGAEVRGLNVDGVTGKHTPEDREWRGRPTILIHLGEVTKERREEAFGVRLRYKLAGAGELGAFGRLALEPLAFPLGPEDDAPQAPLGRMTRALYLPSGYAWLGFEGDGARLFDQGGLWSALEWETARAEGSAYQTGQAIAALEGLAPRTRAGMYPELDTGSGPPLLFEKADGGMSVAVPYASWGAFYLLDVLLIAAVIALGVLLDRRGVSPALYPCAAAAALVLLGHVIGRPAAVFLAAGVVGAAGLGGVWALRGLARELSARRAERREAERAREAQVTKARAQAAEAEARAQAAAGGESR